MEASSQRWYAAIAKENPQSIYWNERASNQAFRDRETSFGWLLDTDLEGDLLNVITKGTGPLSHLPLDGALLRALLDLSRRDPPPDAVAEIARAAQIRRSMSLSSTSFGASRRQNTLKSNVWEHTDFWSDPAAQGDQVAPLFPEPCHRFFIPGDESMPEVRFFEESDDGFALYRRLQTSRDTFGDLQRQLAPPGWQLLQRLVVAGIVTPRKLGEPG